MKKTGLTIIVTLLIVTSIAQETKQNFLLYEQIVPGTKLKFKMAPIPSGNFIMGSSPKEKGRRNEEGPQRKINISAFWMGIHEVTHDEFLAFFNDESVSRNSRVDAVTRPTTQYIDLSWGMGKQGGFPFNSMSQLTALMYCKWLYNKTGIFYRLPTEAEWEYACRAGTSTTYYFGNDIKELSKYAWYAGNSNEKYQKVGQKQPNAWGLFDMLGNVSEWTMDQFDEQYLSNLANNTKDPLTEPVSRYPKTVKGGGFSDSAVALRCAARFRSEPSWNKRDPQIPKSKWWLTDATAVGFRVVRPFKQPNAQEAEAFFQKYTSK